MLLIFFAQWCPAQSPGTPGPPPDDHYARQLIGVWQSADKFAGEPRVVVDLKLEGGRGVGTLVVRGLNQGDSDESSVALKIRDLEFEFAALSFKTDIPQKGTQEWVLRLITGEKALFCAIEDHAEIPKWVLQRSP